MTPKFSHYILSLQTTQQKTWVSTFCSSTGWGLPQPTLVDEQSDTHAMYCWFTRKCAMKVWITFTHTTGYTYSAYPWHHTPHCLWPTLECGNFNQSIDKASCDAFPLCSALPNISGSHQSHHQAVAMQNYENILNNHKVRRKNPIKLLKKRFQLP